MDDEHKKIIKIYNKIYKLNILSFHKKYNKISDLIYYLFRANYNGCIVIIYHSKNNRKSYIYIIL